MSQCAWAIVKITLNFSDLSANSTPVQDESVTSTSLTCASTASRTASRTFSGSKAFWLFSTESLHEQFKSVQELEKGKRPSTSTQGTSISTTYDSFSSNPVSNVISLSSICSSSMAFPFHQLNGQFAVTAGRVWMGATKVGRTRERDRERGGCEARVVRTRMCGRARGMARDVTV